MDCQVCQGHGEWTCPICAPDLTNNPQATDCLLCHGQPYVICSTCGGSGLLEE